MLATLMAKIQSLKEGQWLVFMGLLVSLASAGVEFGIFTGLHHNYSDRLFYLGVTLTALGVVFIFNTNPLTPSAPIDVVTTDCFTSRAIGERQRGLMDLHDRAIYETDADGDVVYVNKNYLNLADRVPCELKGTNWMVSIHPKDRDRVMRDWNNSIDGHRRFESDYTLLREDGDTHLVHNAASPLVIQGVPFGWLGVVDVIGEGQDE